MSVSMKSRNTKPKKESKTWYLSATHLLTSIITIPLLLLTIPNYLAFGSGNQFFMDLVYILYTPSIWIGVIYSANYINKKYIINDKSKIVKLSTIYLIGLFVFGFILTIMDKNIMTYYRMLFIVVLNVITVIGFYLLSNKFIKNNN